MHLQNFLYTDVQGILMSIWLKHAKQQPIKILNESPQS